MIEECFNNARREIDIRVHDKVVSGLVEDFIDYLVMRSAETAVHAVADILHIRACHNALQPVVRGIIDDIEPDLERRVQKTLRRAQHYPGFVFINDDSAGNII